MSTAQFLLSSDGAQIASDIRNFVAPIAAVIIGVIGLKYLFGDQRSLAGFIGFLVLGIVVFTLIKWGEIILDSLGGVFRGWVEPSSPQGIDLQSPNLPDYVTAVVASMVVLLAGGIVRARRATQEDFDEKVIRAIEQGDSADDIAKRYANTEEARRRITKLVEEPVLMERAERVALDWLPNNAREAKRLVNQVRLAMLVMSSRGLLAKNSPVSPEHVAKWVLLNEKWPELVEQISQNPAVLGDLERGEPELGTEQSEQRRFLASEPSLRPVIRELLHVLPRSVPSDDEVAGQ